jgi:hypothetical protein
MDDAVRIHEVAATVLCINQLINIFVQRYKNAK